VTLLANMEARQRFLVEALPRIKRELAVVLREEQDSELLHLLDEAITAPVMRGTGRTIGLKVPDDVRERLARQTHARGLSSYAATVMTAIRMGLSMMERLSEPTTGLESWLPEGADMTPEEAQDGPPDAEAPDAEAPSDTDSD
jgi:hypothetical protein